MKAGIAILIVAIAAVSGRVTAAPGDRPKLMLSPEVRSGIDLPLATEGTVPLSEKWPTVEMADVRKGDGRVILLAGKEQSLLEATKTLFAFAELDRDQTAPNQPSRVPVVIYTDGGVRWREVQWLLQICADPDVRIWRISLAVKTGDGVAALPFTLPMDRQPPKGETELAVVLKRTRGEKTTRFVLGDEPYGTGHAGLLALKAGLKPMLASSPARPVNVNAWAEVPLSDVVSTVAALRAMGAEDILFTGAPAPASGLPEQTQPVEWALPKAERSKIDPPVASTGMILHDKETPFLEVAVTAETGKYFAGGSAGDAAALKELLRKASVGRRDRSHTPPLSRIPVLVFANADTPWKEVRTILEVCADPHVYANRISFAVKQGDEVRALPVWLPVDEVPEGVAWLGVGLERTSDPATKVTLHGEELGSGEKGFATLAAVLRSVRTKHPDRPIYGQVKCSPEVPYGDVVRAVDAFRTIRVMNVRFE